MSDLNKKNINYGALNRFYQDLKSHDLSDLNDKIDNIDVPEYVAGEGIAIDSANTISCTVKPIADASVLPDASENKSKLIRLESDDNVYLSKNALVNAPDSEQIDKAYMYTSDYHDDYYYKGETTIHCTDGDFTTYIWLKRDDFSDIDNIYFTTYNAESIIDDSTFVAYYAGEYQITGLSYNNTDYNCTMTVSQVQNVFATYSEDVFDNIILQHGIYLIQNNEYQWKILLTEDNIKEITNYSKYKNEINIGRGRVSINGLALSIVATMNHNQTGIVWDNLSPRIPSGKTVEVLVVLINNLNTAEQTTMLGNYQMMGAGNITIQPNEIGLYRGTYISALGKWLVEAVNQEVSGTAE